MRDDAVLGRALPLDRGLGPYIFVETYSSTKLLLLLLRMNVIATL